MRFGVNAQYHIMPEAKFDPWVGLGVGYEMTSLSQTRTILGQSIKADTSMRGWEFVNIQVGGDYKVAPGLALGPFASFALGQYGSQSVEINGQSQTEDVANKTMHQWLTFGIRGSFVL
jgi:hypothetical protein